MTQYGSSRSCNSNAQNFVFCYNLTIKFHSSSMLEEEADNNNSPHNSVYHIHLLALLHYSFNSLYGNLKMKCNSVGLFVI